MEDWLHFVDTFACYIFKDVLPPLVLVCQMWDLLSTSIRHYFRPRHFDSRSAFLIAAKQAHDALLKFATLAERNEFSACTFTANLHMCICRCVVSQVGRVRAGRGFTGWGGAVQVVAKF